ncbi:MAG: methionyl-tRNA formyltransferase [Candidatus Terrybacteria bacterium RIFCSPLOWO2_02_42_20]|uniref:Methionyl-tRNA formyltransferase n=2 Tax=Candidatus Terryibacteriota TaxID=1817920 RepID=A0A1G2PSJ5_9BACT|nr:MAG: methionyl-tRNA formyltransferase [Candidatus Terrybacteria bacterium RIFCSPHIGHO2_02_41_19]OHA54263.1 MAG: methionyl-tRNA formyltransferase [Candidatus Terrybacteria bacterium RIFCSPLOWO2_02_42_20]
MTNKNLNFVFFGTSEFAVKILDKLIENGYVPSLVITTPDKPKGRKMIMTPPPVKVFAQAHNLKIIQPERLAVKPPSGGLTAKRLDLFIVASYGKIIPKSILDIPKFGTLNVHPSLLPKFRGPSPIQSFILSGEEKTGVTIMLMDEQVDHGQILSQKEFEARSTKHEFRNKFQIQNSENLKLNAKQLEEKLAELGGQMLVDVIPKWIKGEIKAKEQDHSQATFTKKTNKEDGFVDLEKDSPEIIYRKFLAFQPWPGIYYFTQKNNQKNRVIITDIEFQNGRLLIKKVKPESKKEMEYEKFMNL